MKPRMVVRLGSLTTSAILAAVSTEQPDCPLCGALVFRKSRLYTAHHLVKCTACGFHFSLFEPSPDELADLYGQYTMIRDLSPVTALRYDALLRAFEPYRRTGIFCEVGSGGGLLLDRAAAAKWNCRGTEYDVKVVEECRQRGLIMHCGPLRDHPWPHGSADVVVSIEVVEHLPRPIEDLREMMALLRPGGALYITTPNFNSISKWLAYGKWTVVNYPEHISFFTPHTMHQALTALGMRRKWVRTTGISLNRLRRARGKSDITAEGISNDEQLRRKIERRPLLKLAKQGTDALLNLVGMGDTLKVFYEKPFQ